MMERSVMMDSKVTHSVRGEHAHGLRIRQRRLARDSGILLAIKSEVKGNCLHEMA